MWTHALNLWAVLPIPVPMETVCTAVAARPRPRRIDPPLVAAVVLLLGLVAWIAAPAATGATTQTSDLQIDLEVPNMVAVTPGWTSGDRTVQLGTIAIPGTQRTASSGGWQMATNWANGYEVSLRSTTAPALRGANAVDGRGAKDSFVDFSTAAACPCGWTTGSATRGVFGFSAQVNSVAGPPAGDTAKWGTASSLRWRGMGRTSYRIYTTPGGTGTYDLTLYFRTELPENGVQAEGSYRATGVLAVAPIM